MNVHPPRHTHTSTLHRLFKCEFLQSAVIGTNVVQLFISKWYFFDGFYHLFIDRW